MNSLKKLSEKNENEERKKEENYIKMHLIGLYTQKIFKGGFLRTKSPSPPSRTNPDSSSGHSAS